MADFTAVADVGETLITLLRDNMNIPNPTASVVLLSPADVEDQNIRLTLFLYTVMENPHLKNQEMRDLSPTQLGYPPLTLDLYYLLTAHASTRDTDGTLQEHEILGRAMRIFSDNGILSGTTLQGSLTGTDEELRIVLNPMSLDDVNKIWTTFQEVPYRLSVSYLVTPVRIDSTRSISAQRVVSKEMNYFNAVPKGE
jgi:hypothetical protein